MPNKGGKSETDRHAGRLNSQKPNKYINIDTIQHMAKIEDILIHMKDNPADVRFSDLSKVCVYYFGQARRKDGSHHVYKTPWRGDPLIIIQNYKGKAKAYHVKQVLLAIDKLEVENAVEK